MYLNMIRHTNSFTRTRVVKAAALLVAGFMAGTILNLQLHSQSAAAPAVTPAKVGKPTHYRPDRVSRRAESYYDMVWGLDSLKVKSVEAGALIRFTYRVLDPAKAKPLNDEKNEPSLVDLRAGAKLVVPAMEKVGKLRQVSTPEAGKMYWMAFSNKGGLVKLGDRIDIVIGNFHANGLVVE
jgi:hypothetical protein